MENLMDKLSKEFGDVADNIKQQADYYSNTEEGKAEIKEAARQAGRVIGETGRLLWAIANGITHSSVKKAKTVYTAGQQVYHGEYQDAGKTLVNMEVDRFKALGKTTATAAGAVVDGAILMVAKEEQNIERRKRFRQRLKQCAVAGGVILVGADLLVDDDVEAEDEIADYSEVSGGLPLMEIDDMPGVENGVLVDSSPDNLTAMAQQGEFAGTMHETDVVRHPEIRAEFLASHGFTETPPGWEVHHVVPLSEGGADSPDNMVLLREQDHDWITARHRQFYGWPGPEYWNN